MTDSENFLERWSRKKTEAAREPEDHPAADTRPGDEAPSLPLNAESKPLPAAANPAFDLSKLPSLDSITSASDVRAFMMPGVPPELTRAALRRAWMADPAIRNFVGLSENAWDFTDPSAMPGFGDIPVGYDLKKMVAEVFGELDRKAEQPAQPSDQVAVHSQPLQPVGESGDHRAPAAAPSNEAADQPDGSVTAAGPSTSDFVQRDSNAALQNSSPQDDPGERKIFRTHGRALPKV
jgi:Protein of unknown function (DUF3306)